MAHLPAVHYTQTDTVPSLAYYDSGGNAPALVFLHGLASNHTVWQANFAFLSRYYRCLAPDLPGHGLSDKGNHPYNIPFYAETIRQWLQGLGLKQCTVVAHSMGAQALIYLLDQHPELPIDRIVLVAPAGFERFSLADSLLIKQVASVQAFGASQYMQQLLRWRQYLRPENSSQKPKYVLDLEADWFDMERNIEIYRVLSRSMIGMIDAPIFDKLSRVTQPTLVLFGEKDKLIPNPMLYNGQKTADIARQGAAQLPNSTLKIYENSGHFLPCQWPERFNIEVYRFLNPTLFAPNS
ncbi:alpha/beta fold hydrolase [Eisenibacter elegans]|jgi:pimeloyl-ACP methyl ester carboxylesterase|uniref:alpha/beta fold hydrolase n=1 Tax=Eisenibacter elegans TaxID=997 RepID=UPI000418760C|nr:alpha/beta hydrolase [Eisenibacter elegans]